MSTIQFIPAYLEPEEWADGATAKDLRAYAAATLQVTGLDGGDSITVSMSLDGDDYAAIAGMARASAVQLETIAANGVFDFPAAGFLKWAQTGSASTPTVILRAGA